MHLKRLCIEKTWPIPRKGSKYLVVPNNSKRKGLPLLVAMREMLELVKTRKELKKVLDEGKVLINGKPVKEEKYSLKLFDVISIPVLSKNYRLSIGDNRKFLFDEIKDSEKDSKISKVIGKKILKGNKTQINFLDGSNLLTEDKISVNDSVEIDLQKNKIKKVLPIKEKSKVLIIKGKHIGTIGEVSKVDEKEIMIKLDEKEIKLNDNEIIVLN